MEQARYWMWTKQKHGLNFHVQAPSSTTNTKAAGYGDSWEEQAFAEDAAGALGGCIWPPRSYTCTFCRREFRSAQALGGHMNVHRRDRARLKQSSNPHNETIHLTDPSTTAATATPLDVVHDLHYPPRQICAFLDHKPNHHVHVLAPPSSASRVLVPPIIQEKSSSCRGDQMALGSPNFSCPVVREHKKRITISSSLSSPPSRSNVAADRHFHLSDPPKHEGDNINTKLDSGYRAKRDYVKADLSVSLNLVVCRARPDMSGSKEEEEEEEEGTVNCKRQRTDLAAPFFLKPSSVVDRHGPPRSEVLQLSPSSIDELDLELRLGTDPPKVK